MYSDLIIGFDGSPGSRDALALGRRLALATGARVTVLRARGDPAGRLDDEDTFQHVRDASPARALHRAAREADAALIVLGGTHRSGVGRVIPGTTADAVIRGAPCAVAIAPAGYAERLETRPFGLVVAAVDGRDETERVAAVAARIAARADADLRLLAVDDGPHRDAAFLAAGSYATVADLVAESPGELLVRAAKAASAAAPVEIERRVAEGVVGARVAFHSRDADLLVIGSRGYGTLRRVVLGSATGRILRAAVCPVLVVPRRVAAEADELVVPIAAAGVAWPGALGSSTLASR